MFVDGYPLEILEVTGAEIKIGIPYGEVMGNTIEAVDGFKYGG